MIRTYKTRGYKYRYRCDISGLIMLFLAAVVIAGAFYGLSQWEGCLIHGIDYNGKNEPFGLFC